MIEDAKVSSSSSVNVSVVSNAEFPVAALHTEDDYHRALAKIKELEDKLKAEKEENATNKSRNIKLQNTINELKRLNACNERKVAFYEEFFSSMRKSFTMMAGEFIERIRSAGIRLSIIGRNLFLKWLRDNNFLYLNSDGRNRPTQKSIDEELLVVKKNPTYGVDTVSVLTGKGIVHFVDLLANMEEDQ